MTVRRAAAACVGVGLAGLVATYAFFVRTAAGQRLDDRLHLDEGRRDSWRLLRAYDRHVLVGELVVLVGILAVTIARHQPRRGVLCVAMAPVTVVLADLGKQVLGRPDLAPDWTRAAVNTFPSGHVGFAAATVAAVLLAVPLIWRPFVAVIGLPAVGLVLLATVQAHWHRASDGIGSIFLVIAMSGLVVLLSPARPTASTAVRDRARELVSV